MYISANFHDLISVHQAQSHLTAASMVSSKLIPDNIRNLLVKEADWDFDIIELERVTHKRYIVFCIGLVIVITGELRE